MRRRCTDAAVRAAGSERLPALTVGSSVGLSSSTVGGIDRLTGTARWSVTLLGSSLPNPVLADVQHGGGSLWAIGYLPNPDRIALRRFALNDGTATGCFPMSLRWALPYKIGRLHFVVDDGYPIVADREQDHSRNPAGDPFTLVLPGRDLAGACK